jgi:low temperature requirement protein LtrA
VSTEPGISIESQDEDVRVSTLELFFDLVFVFTITQLTATGTPCGRAPPP